MTTTEDDREALEHLFGAEFKASRVMRSLMANAVQALGFTRPTKSPEETSEWESARWTELVSDTEDGGPTGDTIRLSWPDGTVLIGRLTVPSRGAGHHQMCRMLTVFGGDTWVWAHGSTLERRTRS